MFMNERLARPFRFQVIAFSRGSRAGTRPLCVQQ